MNQLTDSASPPLLTNDSQPITTRQVAALLVSGAAYAELAYATPREEFGQLLGLFAVAFGLYAWLLYSRLPLRAGMLAALLLRLLWLPALPALSDDYHRFRWDGLLVANGLNPYQYRPDQAVFRGPVPEFGSGSAQSPQSVRVRQPPAASGRSTPI